MASKREKQGDQSLVQEERRQKRSNNQPATSSRPLKAADKRSAPAKSGEKRNEKRNSSVKSAERRTQARTAEKTGERRTSQGRTAEKTPEVAATPSMNREMKRMMRKRDTAADRLRRPTVAQRGKRTKPLTFVKEVRGELGRVSWPTRPEVITYTVVVIVTVTFFLLVIGAMDYVFLKGILFLIERKGS